MKKFLLISGVAAVSLVAWADDVPQPTIIEDVFFSNMSPDGNYMLSEGNGAIRIFNLAEGKSYNFKDEEGLRYYKGGNGKCVSNNGIVVGTTDYMNAEYFKDGDWHLLKTPEYASSNNVVNAITPDGSRMCGSIGVAELGLALDGDALMQAPCIWNATEDGYGMPVMLPYPEKDFTGRIPQYVIADDISEDGKTIVGMITSATGMVNYPIIFKENEDGEWSYDIINEELLNPDNLVFPEYPGDGPLQPSQFDFMSEEEKEEYDLAVSEYYESGGTIAYPDVNDYLSDAEMEEYLAAMAEYNAVHDVWYASLMEWFEVHEACLAAAPGYIFNSVRISPDAKTIGCTVENEISTPDSWFPTFTYSVYTMDVESGDITKYDQFDDLNLTYLGNDGVALASTSVGSSSDSFVLSGGNAEGMFDWMSRNCSGYGTWMSENMVFDVTTIVGYDEETWDPIFSTETKMLTGRAIGTPDLSVIALTVENTWDFMSDKIGDGYIFDIKAYKGAAVGVVNSAAAEKTIYDLSGRKLSSVSAPGIYIINGKKTVVR